MARAADSLNQRCDLPRRVVLDNFVDRPYVDAELEGACRDEPFDLPRLEARLDPLPLLSRQGAVMDSYILAHHRQPRPEQLSEGARVHEDQGRPALIEGVIDGGKARGGLGSDVHVAGCLEVLVDGPRPFHSIVVLLLQGRRENCERLLAEKRRD